MGTNTPPKGFSEACSQQIQGFSAISEPFSPPKKGKAYISVQYRKISSDSLPYEMRLCSIAIGRQAPRANTGGGSLADGFRTFKHRESRMAYTRIT